MTCPWNQGEDAVRRVPPARTSISTEATLLSGVAGSEADWSSDTLSERGVRGMLRCCGEGACGDPGDPESNTPPATRSRTTEIAGGEFAPQRFGDLSLSSGGNRSIFSRPTPCPQRRETPPNLEEADGVVSEISRRRPRHVVRTTGRVSCVSSRCFLGRSSSTVLYCPIWECALSDLSDRADSQIGQYIGQGRFADRTVQYCRFAVRSVVEPWLGWRLG